MRYKVLKADDTVVEEGLPLRTAAALLEQRANQRGAVGERVVHDPLYPLYVTNEESGLDDYTIYASMKDMTENCRRDCRMVQIKHEVLTQGGVVKNGEVRNVIAVRGASDRQIFDLSLRLDDEVGGMGL